ncbi:hypothetical protein Tco_0820483 [Tanacetum coccineum]|uniref:Uncharacterized protein n=1 Tax=Tanacetum coccineum TaxID=301880 RepID=A0ABQ5AB82_9ASTR
MVINVPWFMNQILATPGLMAKLEAHNEDIQRNLKFTSEDQVRGGLLGIIINRLKSGSYRVKSGRHIDLDVFKLAIVLQKAKQIQDFGPTLQSCSWSLKKFEENIANDVCSMLLMTSVHISSGLVLHQMTSDHNRSELGIQDHSNEQSSSKLVPKVIP